MARQETTPAHEYAGIFALHEGEPLWKLSDRIKEYGLREPIVLLDGKILDGRRRELACFRAGVKPSYREFGSRKTDGDDPLAFVFDVNFHRRHLGPVERDLAAAKYATAARGRQKTAQNTGNQMPQVAAFNTGQNVSAKATRAEAAEKFDTTEARVERAKTVLAKGSESLQEAVSDGTLSVSDAAKAASEPKRKQDAAVAAVRAGKARTVSANPSSGIPGYCPTCGRVWKGTTFVKPTLDEVAAYCRERKNNIDPEAFIDYYDSNGWRVGGKSRMKDWRKAVHNWERMANERRAKEKSKHKLFAGPKAFAEGK